MVDVGPLINYGLYINEEEFTDVAMTVYFLVLQRAGLAVQTPDAKSAACNPTAIRDAC